MTSQRDLDQGGTSRAWVRVYMGPSIGWVRAPGGNVLLIVNSGIYSIDLSTSLIEVQVNAGVTIILPSAIPPTAGPTAVPGPFVGNPITIVDIGGFAAANPIIIQPNNAGENIVGQTQIQIATNFGGYSLLPNAILRGWNIISP